MIFLANKQDILKDYREKAFTEMKLAHAKRVFAVHWVINLLTKNSLKIVYN